MRLPHLCAVFLVAVPAGCHNICANGPCEVEQVNGWQWCALAIGANGTDEDGVDVQIKYEDESWTRGCVVMCSGDNQIMNLGHDGEIMPGDELEPLWEDLKEEVRDKAEDRCEERTSAIASEIGSPIGFGGMNDITCLTAVSIPEPYRGNAVITDECAVAWGDTGTGGDPQHSEVGPARYGLSSYNQVRNCSTNTSTRTISCNVDVDFAEMVAEDVRSIFSDNAKLRSVQNPSGYLFTTCAPSSLLYALGFRVGDRLVSVNNHPVGTFDQSADVFGDLGHAPYGSAPVKARFYRSGNLWTLSVNRTDLTSYP